MKINYLNETYFKDVRQKSSRTKEDVMRDVAKVATKAQNIKKVEEISKNPKLIADIRSTIKRKINLAFEYRSDIIGNTWPEEIISQKIPDLDVLNFTLPDPQVIEAYPTHTHHIISGPIFIGSAPNFSDQYNVAVTPGKEHIDVNLVYVSGYSNTAYDSLISMFFKDYAGSWTRYTTNYTLYATDDPKLLSSSNAKNLTIEEFFDPRRWPLSDFNNFFKTRQAKLGEVYHKDISVKELLNSFVTICQRSNYTLNDLFGYHDDRFYLMISLPPDKKITLLHDIAKAEKFFENMFGVPFKFNLYYQAQKLDNKGYPVHNSFYDIRIN